MNLIYNFKIRKSEIKVSFLEDYDWKDNGILKSIVLP